MAFESYYSRDRMARAQRAAQQDAARRAPARSIGQGGRLVMRVPTVAVHNAIRTEGKAVLYPEAEGYWKDMAKRHPELVVKQADSNAISMVGLFRSSRRSGAGKAAPLQGGKLGEILRSRQAPQLQ